jgi:predicted RNase H-like HicB family nuclease
MTPIDDAVVIERLPDAEGGGYVAVVPDLPGCMSVTTPVRVIAL